MHGPSLSWAEIVWTDFVMGRVCNGPSLLWAEMSRYLIFNDILHMSFLAGTHVFKAYPAYTTTEI